MKQRSQTRMWLHHLFLQHLLFLRHQFDSRFAFILLQV
ncbi:hypothetical protein NECAME_19423 [Necator americanus]|uniref:Uncharacterized protein n=1 Tax=Necator americanus TaxID=51031 RepID=W2SLN1_NECAM|nr:hypothetical protein NECAME_19423 [Necator americanus]ETN70530.1 hypothetical protein NECAME_19423 [Necator americanus]